MSDVVKILYRDNIPFDESYKNLLINYDFYQIYRKFDDEDHYSSYNNFKNTRPETELVTYCDRYYQNIVLGILGKYNLRKGSDWDLLYWWQMYNDKTSGHGDHTHFDPSHPTIFSFVHFINVNEKDPCFHFVNENGDEEYIKEKSNDFVLFGSWSRHRVKKPSSSETRAIIAGNISITKHIGSSQYFD